MVIKLENSSSKKPGHEPGSPGKKSYFYVILLGEKSVQKKWEEYAKVAVVVFVVCMC